MSFFENVSPQMDDYLEEHISQENEELKALRKETYQKVTQPHMLSGAMQGRFLSIISQMLMPKRILEIGTFTGYATLCLAEGLTKQGKIYTLDCNEELSYLPKKHFEKSRFCNQIEFILGDARTSIPSLDEVFDLVFIDADKENYIAYLELIKPKLRSGSVVLIDNVLWYGNVLEKEPKLESTRCIQKLNKIISEDEDFENVILPLRDGIHMLRKK